MSTEPVDRVRQQEPGPPFLCLSSATILTLAPVMAGPQPGAATLSLEGTVN